MIYLLYGEEEFLIEEEIKNIIKKSKIENINISKYDFEIDNIQDIIDDAYTISLFENKKIIIAKNLDKFLKNNDKEISLLEKYLGNQNEDVILIITSQSLDDRKKIVKTLKKQSTTKEFNKNKNISNTVRKMFDEYKIDYKTIDILIKNVGTNLKILYQEAEKLKTYKQDKIITEQDVLELSCNSSEEDIFNLINYIINKNKEEAFRLYKILINKNEEPLKIIITLANQFRIIYQSKELYKKGNNEDGIAKILNIHPYRVKLALEKGKNYSSKILLEYLLKLAELDSQIKNGLIDKYLGLELFIIEN